MKIGGLIAVVFSMGVATGVLAQTAAPKLSADEMLVVEAVRALQAQANTDCQALPSTKSYREILQKSDARLRAAHPDWSMNWATFQLQPIPVKK